MKRAQTFTIFNEYEKKKRQKEPYAAFERHLRVVPYGGTSSSIPWNKVSQGMGRSVTWHGMTCNKDRNDTKSRKRLRVFCCFLTTPDYTYL